MTRNDAQRLTTLPVVQAKGKRGKTPAKKGKTPPASALKRKDKSPTKKSSKKDIKEDGKKSPAPSEKSAGTSEGDELNVGDYVPVKKEVVIGQLYFCCIA